MSYFPVFFLCEKTNCPRADSKYPDLGCLRINLRHLLYNSEKFASCHMTRTTTVLAVSFEGLQLQKWAQILRAVLILRGSWGQSGIIGEDCLWGGHDHLWQRSRSPVCGWDAAEGHRNAAQSWERQRAECKKPQVGEIIPNSRVSN